MEVSYRRDLNHNYMILENEKVTGREYPVRMIEQNSIPEFLDFQLRKMNGKTYLYYEITSRQPLTQVYETVSMKSRDIEQLLMGIQNVLQRVRQYLLNNEDILLSPEFIYMNVETGKIQLCYVPFSGENSEKSFLTLAEFILKRLDHGERRAVELGYELFRQASQENFSLQESLKVLLREHSENKKCGRKSKAGKDSAGKSREMKGKSVKRQAGRGKINVYGKNRYEKDIYGADEYDVGQYDIDKYDMNGYNADESGVGGYGADESGVGGYDADESGVGGYGADEYEMDECDVDEYGMNRNDGKYGTGKYDMKECERNIYNAKIYDRGEKAKNSRSAGKNSAGSMKGKLENQAKEKNKRKRIKAAQKREISTKNKEEKRENKKYKILISTVVIAFTISVFTAIVYFARLDLTQTGGLAFLFLAVLWIIFGIVEGRKEKKKKHWLEEGDDEEEEFERELFSEIYNKESGECDWRNGSDLVHQQELCGETRCLTEEEYEKSLRLVSLEPELYPDIVLSGKKVIIGKKRDQVDVWLRMDCISRIHAKLEKSDGKYFLTDLNSMNGTFINGERLRPNEVKQICRGDKISFATLHYKVKEI